MISLLSAIRFLRPSAACALGSLAVLCVPAHGQISLTSAVDLAVRSSAKVKMAQADVDKALAGVQESKDVFIPAVSGGANIGEAAGYSTNPPTLFTITAQSLVFSSAQHDYIRSAEAGLAASRLSLADAKDAVAQDTALAFIGVDHDQKRESTLRQQLDDAKKLVSIEEDRFNAGRDTAIDDTTAKLTAAQIHLSYLRAQDMLADDREHLARLIGLPAASLLVGGDLPPMPSGDVTANMAIAPLTPGVASAFANAHAKQEQAFGDARFLLRPQISLFAQYNRYATFVSSFKQLTEIYGKSLGANEEAFGVQINIPVLDKGRQAKARQSQADAAHAMHEAEDAQFQSLNGRSKLVHSVEELQVREEVAELDQQLAAQQLDALTAQLNTSSSNTNGPQLTPKDEQNSRIAEREKYLILIDAAFELRQAQIYLLREAGQIENWVQQAPTTTVGPAKP